ncbi:GFA family protein [Aquabacterium sp.]|uniref:GFA family protein n=1 Tax=Aquabacterium sp. TaxID=1872578 RepID=UPI003782F898
MSSFSGGCLCGSVRFQASGPPYRVGICHCLDCRKHHGALFHASAVFPQAAVQVSGPTQQHAGRHFCPQCGSPVFSHSADEINVNLGALDAPDQLQPSYELWTVRRESWLPAFPVARRYARDRENAGREEPPPMAAARHLRVARPVSALAPAVRMYQDGLSLALLGSFEDHEGFDGVMLGDPGGQFHFEFTRCRHHPVAPAPTPEDLFVFYEPQAEAWAARCAKMLEAGFAEVAPFNPYWSRQGRSFQDPDGYRVVIQQARWANQAAAPLQPPASP